MGCGSVPQMWQKWGTNGHQDAVLGLYSPQAQS